MHSYDDDEKSLEGDYEADNGDLESGPAIGATGLYSDEEIYMLLNRLPVSTLYTVMK